MMAWRSRSSHGLLVMPVAMSPGPCTGKSSGRVLQEGAEVMNRLLGGVNNVLAGRGDRHPFTDGGAPPLEVEPFGGEDDHARVVQDPWVREVFGVEIEPTVRGTDLRRGEDVAETGSELCHERAVGATTAATADVSASSASATASSMSKVLPALVGILIASDG